MRRNSARNNESPPCNDIDLIWNHLNASPSAPSDSQPYSNDPYMHREAFSRRSVHEEGPELQVRLDVTAG